MSQKRKRSPSPPAAAPSTTTNPKETATTPAGEGGGAGIYISSPLTDRSSTFQALYSPSASAETLQSHPLFHTAQHRILGWRRPSNQQTISGTRKFVSGHDDDGEKFAGRKVENVLKSAGVQGTCVVARWFGGELLGPVRFAHIESVAGEAVGMWRAEVEEEKRRVMREEEEEREKGELVGGLKRRDGSIAVLRGLAAEKEGLVKKEKGEEVVESTAPVGEVAAAAVAVEYEKMDVTRLRALDKARDATLAFLLKRIDRAEAELSRLKKMKPEDETERDN